MTPLGSYGWAYSSPIPKAKDNSFKTYSDLVGNMLVEWATTTLKIGLTADQTKSNYFESSVGQDVYGASTTKFNAVQFHFHSPSEHTHNGKHYDLEMHIVHTADNVNSTTPIMYAAVGIFFDVLDFDPTITTSQNNTVKNFLNGLKFGDKN